MRRCEVVPTCGLTFCMSVTCTGRHIPHTEDREQGTHAKSGLLLVRHTEPMSGEARHGEEASFYRSIKNADKQTEKQQAGCGWDHVLLESTETLAKQTKINNRIKREHRQYLVLYEVVLCASGHGLAHHQQVGAQTHDLLHLIKGKKGGHNTQRGG